jgi:hypothetical protein
MISREGYSILVFWGAGRETPETLAQKFDRLIDRLTLIDPVFGNWFWPGDYVEPIVTFASIRGELAERIAAAVVRADDGEPCISCGYRLTVFNSLKTTPRNIAVRIRAGNRTESKSIYSNTGVLDTNHFIVPDPAIVTYQVFKPALLALAETFDATFGFAFPSSLGPLWPVDQKFKFGWINYVAPRFAPLVTPPQSAIVEYRPNGGLLMAATDETFVTSNPRHLAVARDIEATLAPLNALPWPLDAEPEHATRNDLH